MPKKKSAKKVIKKIAKKKVVKKIAKPKKKNNGLVKVSSPVRSDMQFYVASEMADDSLIEQQVSGQVVKTMVYQFQQGDKTITGLSKNGVDEVVRRINKNPASGSRIRISPEAPIIQYDVTQNAEKGVMVMVYAEDLISGNGAWGSKFEPYQKSGKHGRTYSNDFALEKALSKAQRNAARKLIPEQLAIKVIENIIKDNPNSVQQIEAPKVIDRAIIPTKTDEEVTYAATLKRISEVSSNRASLEMALGRIDGLIGLTPEQKEIAKNIIKDHLTELGKNK